MPWRKWSAPPRHPQPVGIRLESWSGRAHDFSSLRSHAGGCDGLASECEWRSSRAVSSWFVTDTRASASRLVTDPVLYVNWAEYLSMRGASGRRCRAMEYRILNFR